MRLMTVHILTLLLIMSHVQPAVCRQDEQEMREIEVRVRMTDQEGAPIVGWPLSLFTREEVSDFSPFAFAFQKMAVKTLSRRLGGGTKSFCPIHGKVQPSAHSIFFEGGNTERGTGFRLAFFHYRGPEGCGKTVDYLRGAGIFQKNL